MIYFLHAFLALMTFLLILNSFLRGSQKRQISILLGIFLVAALIACFIVGGKAGLLALVSIIFYGVISRPLAARFAAKLLARPGETAAQYIGLPTLALERIAQNLSSPDSLEQIVKGVDEREKALIALLDYCEANAEIQETMKEFKASRETLREFYTQLIEVGAGQWRGGHFVPASAVAYPHTLRYIFKHHAKRDLPPEVAWKLLMHFESGATLEQETHV